MIRSLRASLVADRGSGAIELVIGLPAVGLFIGLIVFGGRVALARQSVQDAATEAARTASIARSTDVAQSQASAAAAATLANQGLRCSTTTVTVDTTGFAAPVGTPATVVATVSCTVDLSDLSVPGIPGTKTIVATMPSAIDTYRERS